MSKLALLIVLGIFLISPIIAEQETLGVFQKDSEIMLKQTCSNCTFVEVISVEYPNGTYALRGNYAMEKNGATYNYSFNNSSPLGDYIYCTTGDVDGTNTTVCVDFQVTRSGQNFNSQDGGLAIAILIGVLGSSVIFMIMGNKLSENTKTMPLALIFSFLSITLVLYSLNLGWVYSQNIMQFDAIGNVSQVIFTSFLWIIIGVVVISMALMLISFITHLTKVVERKKFGEDFDPISETYM